jgi:hypothetical protein
LVWYDDSISGRDEVIDLAAPGEPELGKTVEENQRFTVSEAGKNDV